MTEMTDASTPHDKLVRDRIPEIIAATGARCEVLVLEEAEYGDRLDQKLAEELAEYDRDGDVGELVDLVEVVQAIVEWHGMSWAAFERLREEKRAARGGFAGRWLLVSVSK